MGSCRAPWLQRLEMSVKQSSQLTTIFSAPENQAAVGKETGTRWHRIVGNQKPEESQKRAAAVVPRS